MLLSITTTLEYQNWGVTTVTLSFFLSVGLTLFTAWGLVQQNETLWREQTGDAVSILWLSYYAVLQLVILTYGFFIGSVALMINGLLAFLYVPILIGLWRYKGFTHSEKVAVTLFLAALAAMIVTPYKPLFFLAFAIGGLISALTQPIEMWRKKSAHGLDLKLVMAILFGNIVWLIYGVAVIDWVLISINAIAFGIFGTTIALARAYGELEKDCLIP